MTRLESPSGEQESVPPLLPRPPLPPPPYLVAGLARAGQAAVRALSDVVGPELVRAWDSDTGASMQQLRRRLELAGIRTYLGARMTRREVGFARTVVKSPGMPFSTQVIQRALGKRREVIDELELGWRLTHCPVLAVTGTNGKSTVCGLAHSVLTSAGRKVKLAGNTEFGDPLSMVPSEALDWILCEVSSFQLEGCVSMLPELAVFTNLTPEHLGRHGSIEAYGAIKRRLFINGGRCVPRAVIDIDTPFGLGLAGEVESRGGSVTRVGLSRRAEYRVESTIWNLRTAKTDVSTPTGRVSLRTSLPGAYNARNLAAALAIADLIGLDRRLSIPVLSGYPGAPGRFEHIDEGQPFEVIVDFAHTSDALEQLLVTVRAGMSASGRVIVVFGLGGPPGTTMQRMGQVAASLSDQLVLTTSGFRGLPPIPTLSSILSGARICRGAELEIILGRRRAIEHGISIAGPDDVVVIPGRGALRHVRTDPRGEARPFDDREVARALIRTNMSYLRAGV